MQLTTLLSAAAAVATVSARSAVDLTKSCDLNQPHIRIINRCDYTVNLWSVLKGTGCPTNGMVSLKKGGVYSENFAMAHVPPPNEALATNETGISIKLSRTEQCKGNDIAQVEYYMDNRPDKGIYQSNYYDMSYVDCVSDCPTKQEGFYWSAGTSQIRAMKATADDSWCPTLKCHDAVSCALISYILPDDTRTKTCDLTASMDVYLCGSQPPSEDDNKPASSAPAKQPEPEPKKPEPKPSPTPKPVASAPIKVNVAAVTNAPEIKDAIKAPPKVKTEIVYVTAIEYVNAKRHEHAHARRHQPFHA